MNFQETNQIKPEFRAKASDGNPIVELDEGTTEFHDKFNVSISFDCSEITKSFADIDVNVGEDVNFTFKVICNTGVLRSFDMSLILLFSIAVSLVYVAFHTPDLRIIQNMTMEDLKETELSTVHALLMAVGASIMLLTLYLFLDSIMSILTLWIAFGSTITSFVVISELLIHLPNPSPLSHLLNLPPLLTLSDISVTPFDLLCLFLSSLLSFSWLLTKHWLLNNLLAISLAFVFLKTLRLNKLMPGVVLLSLLFVYDVFWVFVSPRFTKGG